jgi:hypothetical protein
MFATTTTIVEMQLFFVFQPLNGIWPLSFARLALLEVWTRLLQIVHFGSNCRGEATTAKVLKA